MLERFLKPGDGVLDIGANQGDYARKYADVVGLEGRVLAVEPYAETVKLARERCATYPQITVMEAAVSDAMGHETLYLDTDSKRNSLWPANILDDKGGSKLVHTVTLDYLASIMLRPLRGIKVDAQGAEGAILAGGAETLARTDLVWAIELWPFGLKQAGSSVEAVVGVFESYGWRPEGQTWLSVLAACGRCQHPHSAIDIVVMR